MSDLLFSDDLDEYRKAEIEEAVRFTVEMYRGNVSQEYHHGAMDAIRAIVKIPSRMAKTEEGKERAKLMISRAIDEYSGRLTKRMLLDEKDD